MSEKCALPTVGVGSIITQYSWYSDRAGVKSFVFLLNDTMCVVVLSMLHMKYPAVVLVIVSMPIISVECLKG